MAKYANGQIIVEPGDTLWSIYGPNWKQASGFQGDPTKLSVGMVLPPPSTPNAQMQSKAPMQSTAPNQSTTPQMQSVKPSAQTPDMTAGGPMQSPASSPAFVNGTPDWVKPIIAKASEKYQIPSMVISALLKQESGFNPNAKSPVGAMGIAQFMPETARGMGVNPLDPESAIDGAGRYLRRELDRFGKMDLALAAYNAGGGAVQQYGGIPPYKETQNYVKSIMGMVGEPHQSYNQPNLQVVAEAKKQMQSQAPMQSSAPVASSQTSSSSPAGRNPSLEQSVPFQQTAIRNDLGQRYMPGFWGSDQSGFATRTAEGIEQQSNRIMDQYGPLKANSDFSGNSRYAIPRPEEDGLITS